MGRDGDEACRSSNGGSSDDASDFAQCINLSLTAQVQATGIR